MDPVTLGILLTVISAIGGMGLSTFAEMSNEKEAKESRDRLIQQQEDLQKIDQADWENRLANDKQKDFEAAEKQDKATDFKENALSTDFNLALENLFTQQENLGSEYNQAAMQIGQNTGNELAQLANTGVRAGSSVAQAVDLEASVNSAQLDLQEKSQRRSTNNSLASMLNNLGQQKFGVYQERDSADYTRNSWNEGGIKYNQYQNEKTKMDETYKWKIKNIEDDYKDYMKGSNVFKRWISGAFNFGSSVNSIGQNLASLY